MGRVGGARVVCVHVGVMEGGDVAGGLWKFESQGPVQCVC